MLRFASDTDLNYFRPDEVDPSHHYCQDCHVLLLSSDHKEVIMSASLVICTNEEQHEAITFFYNLRVYLRTICVRDFLYNVKIVVCLEKVCTNGKRNSRKIAQVLSTRGDNVIQVCELILSEMNNNLWSSHGFICAIIHVRFGYQNNSSKNTNNTYRSIAGIWRWNLEPERKRQETNDQTN